VLKRQQAAATVCVSTGAIDGRILWFQKLFAAISQTSLTQAPAMMGQDKLMLETPRQRFDAIEAYSRYQIRMTAEEWEGEIDRLADTLKWDGSLAGETMMSWEQVKALHESGLVTVGGHTVSHPVLIRCTPERARREIFNCAEELRSRLNLEFMPFAYPNGVATPGDEALVQEAGFACGFAGRPTRNTVQTSIFQLGRVPIRPYPLATASASLTRLRRGTADPDSGYGFGVQESSCALKPRLNHE